MVVELIGRVVYWFIGIFVGFGMGGFLIYKNVVEVFFYEICKWIIVLKIDEEF